MRKNRFIVHFLIIALAAVAFAACGSSGGGSGGTESPVAVAALAAPAEYIEYGSNVDLDATASTGTGLTYLWTEVSDTGSTITNVSDDPAASSVSLAYADFGEDEAVRKVTLRLTVTDSDGREATDDLVIYSYNNLFMFITPDGDGDGFTPNSPIADIAVAINKGGANGRNALAIVEGTYIVNSTDATPIVMADGISLYGGYGPLEWDRDISIHNSIISDINTTGGTATNDMACPVEVVGASASALDGLTIIGGVGNFTCGVYIQNNASGVTISHNDIRGGGNVDSQSYGMHIYYDARTPIIDSNKIDAGVGDTAGGMYIYGNGARPEIRNNYITALSGISSVGIVSWYPNDSTYDILNNTIISSGNGIFLGDNPGASSVRVANNIIYSSFLYCLYEGSAGADYMNIQNNDLYGCSYALYDYEAQCDSNSTTDSEDNQCTLAQLEALTDSGLIASGNIEEDPLMTDLAGGDYSLTASSPKNVKYGGGNLSSTFTNDITGAIRTAIDGGANNLNAGGWSMGAFEID